MHALEPRRVLLREFAQFVVDRFGGNVGEP
jgi:hypothetical protein